MPLYHKKQSKSAYRKQGFKQGSKGYYRPYVPPRGIQNKKQQAAAKASAAYRRAMGAGKKRRY